MIPFIKMHGCGNDYVFLDCFQNALPADPSRLAQRVSDRNRSIGADGLVLMLPANASDSTTRNTTLTANARMRMFNADGSEGALCGNALRCMAMWLHQSGICEWQFVIEMGGRLIPATIHQSDPQQRSAIVRVQIGSPVLQQPGAKDRSSYVRETVLPGVNLPELIKPVLHVSMGNPHTVLFVRSLSDVDVIQLGSQIEQHPVFPDRTNVEFVEIADGLVKVRVWERGSGETMACGSGACAVAVAGTCCGLFPETTETTVSMRGGDLRVDWTADNNIFLTGPAAESFRGIIHDENV